jgi:hypothetical protein
MSSSLMRYVVRHHVGLLALFVALGGTAYAATVLPPNSVGTRQLRRHAVTLAKINRATQTALRGRSGPPGPAGPSDGYYSSSGVVLAGVTGEHGPSVSVPPGNYIATGGCTAYQGNATGQSISTLTFGTADAILSATARGQQPRPPFVGAPGVFSAIASVPNQGWLGSAHDGGVPLQEGAASLSNSGGFSLPTGGTITETCQDDNLPGTGATGGTIVKNLAFSGYYLTAIKVATLHAGSTS